MDNSVEQTQTEGFIPLAQLVDELKHERELAAEARTNVKTIESIIEIQLLGAKRVQAEHDARVADLENIIREKAVQHYVSTGGESKRFCYGVEIKLFSEMTIEDPDAVRKFCFDGLPAALVVDEKKVRKYALEFDENIPGVKVVRDVPRAQISTKL